MPKNCKDVLIVEDQSFFQDVLELALRGVVPDTVTIRKVASGNEAIRVLTQDKDSIGLILLDMKMDDGDGMEVLKFVEEQSLYNIPIYIVSSLDTEFISFVMQSISELEIRLVGFIPKTSPSSVKKRIKHISEGICGLLDEDHEHSQHRLETEEKQFFTDNILEKLATDSILYVQPKINVQDEVFISGYEVLCRIWDEEFGIIEPSQFLTFIDTLKLKMAFNWHVLDKAIREIKDYTSNGFITCWSINVDPEAISHSDFVNDLMALLNKYELEPEILILEITEVACVDIVRLEFNIARLKLLGIKVSLDDFGKGYANLDRLKRVPFDEVKIDMGLFSNVLQNEEDKEFVVSMLSYMARKGCNVVVEGVEDRETKDFLKKIGAVEVQGYYYSMPKPMSDIENIFLGFFKSRVIDLLGELTPQSFSEIYNDFHQQAIECIDDHLNRSCKNEDIQSDFVHLLKGMLKTAGLFEAVVFVELYKETQDTLYIHKLRSFLSHFNSRLVKKVDLKHSV